MNKAQKRQLLSSDISLISFTPDYFSLSLEQVKIEKNP